MGDDKYLILSAEDMRIILLELPNTSQAVQSSRGFISVKHTKICYSKWQFSITSFTVIKHNTVTRAIHRLQGPLSLLHSEFEHIIFIVIPVTRSAPQPNIVHIWGLHFLITTFAIFGAQQLLECIKNFGAIREEKWATWRNFLEKEQLLLLSNL